MEVDEGLYRRIAQSVIENHMAAGPCLFAPMAVDRIVAEVSVKAKFCIRQQEISEALIGAIQAQEIYCPHEGIDRRAEFGIASDG